MTAAPRQVDPVGRVVLLGASNLTRGISTVVRLARQVAFSDLPVRPGNDLSIGAQNAGTRNRDRPLEIFTALGHGRSYGRPSTVVGRTLPGIAECGLWRALEVSQPLPTVALVTDIGNDLLYEVEVEEIAEWVDVCLARLAARDARVAMTALPIKNLWQVGKTRYRLVRSAIFPRSRLEFATMVERASALDARLRALAAARGAALIEHRAEWYGWDPIHIRSRHRSSAWEEILSAWPRAELTSSPRDAIAPPQDATDDLRGGVQKSLLFSDKIDDFRQWLYLRTRPFELCWRRGIERRHPQPSGRWSDGTTIALY